jgi:nucleoside-diphosphate-sugar epimerase
MTLSPTEKVCFVTGATGFVGLNLIDELLGEKWKVYGLHRPNSKRAKNILKLDNYDEHLFTFVAGTLTCNKDDFIKLVPKDVRYMFHLCHVRESIVNEHRAVAPPGFSYEGAQQHVQLNLLSMKNVLSACEALNLERLIYCSSWSSYGILPPGTNVNEETVSVVDTPVDHKFFCCLGAKNIAWPYGQSKLRCMFFSLFLYTMNCLKFFYLSLTSHYVYNILCR